MTPIVDVIIPTFGRAARLPEVVENIHTATNVDHVVSIVVEEDDHESVAMAEKLAAVDGCVRAVVNERAHNYTGAMNMALEDSEARFWFAGADDLRFHPGWFDEAVRHMDDQIMVVGTNDLLNMFVLNGLHATHYLVDREYTDRWGGTLDQGPGVGYFEGTFHDYSDTEFIGVAKARCRFRPCLESVVEHMHWTAGKAAPDATYAKNQEHLARDRELYQQRKVAWDNLVL